MPARVAREKIFILFFRKKISAYSNVYVWIATMLFLKKKDEICPKLYKIDENGKKIKSREIFLSGNR